MSGASLGTHPRLRRSLAAAIRFHDVFYTPFDERAPLVRSPLSVSIPSLRWTALRVESDATYRFSAPTLAGPAPSGTGLSVEVAALLGDYRNHQPILLNLPRPQSSPPRREDFLLTRPLWPTVAFRPPPGETAIHGQILGTGGVAGLRVVLFQGASPPLLAPHAITDRDGQFLFRFPFLANLGSGSLTLRILVSGASGSVPVTPSAFPAVFGETQLCLFQRT